MDATQAAAMEQRIMQMEHALQHQVQLNAQMQATLLQQQQASAQQMDPTAIGAAIAAQLAQAMKQDSGKKRNVVDIRGIGKPAPFKGKEEEFRTFAHKLTGFMSAVWPQTREVMRWAADQTETFDDDDADLEWNDGQRADPFPEIKDMSAQLHAALIGLVEGESFDLVVGVESGSGLEAWRKLTRRFDPQVAGRSKNMLKHVLNPQHAKPTKC